MYGATKLAAELLITEYEANFGLRTVINRCGVIAGPWQMGRAWIRGSSPSGCCSHHFGRPLAYLGYGGDGHQVRDLLHMDDLIALVRAAARRSRRLGPGFVGNVGGGRERSLSLLETTAICRELTGRTVEIAAAPGDQRPATCRYTSPTARRLYERTDWRPHAKASEDVLSDIHDWVVANEAAVGEAVSWGGFAA